MYIEEGCNEKLLSCSEKSYSKEVNLDGARVIQQILDSDGKVKYGCVAIIIIIFVIAFVEVLFVYFLLKAVYFSNHICYV